MENKNTGFQEKEFKELLRKGIGSRTQKEFAAQTGIAQETISRMLNDTGISCPRIKTLDHCFKDVQRNAFRINGCLWISNAGY